MKTVGIITATRAEYGLLCPVIRKLREKENDTFSVELIITGTHLLQEYGNTIDEIKRDNLRIDSVIKVPMKTIDSMDISDSQAYTLNAFTMLFKNKKYNGVLLLGDRYEMLAIAIAACNTVTPIFHMCGGDSTEGAMDEWIRHSITKMSYLHFVSNENSYRRVIQLGEDPARVFNYGSTSIDNIICSADMTKTEALESIGLADCDYIVCTYHPETLGNDDLEQVIADFICAISSFKSIQFIITKSNADEGGQLINMLFEKAEDEYDNIYVYASLGVRRYLSLLKYSLAVLGNSSSGIIEAPSFGIPTINIGDRQKGRLQCSSIINCGKSCTDIIEAVDNALDKEFKTRCKMVKSPYGDGKAAPRIADKIYEVVNGDNIDLRKKFYDIR